MTGYRGRRIGARLHQILCACLLACLFGTGDAATAAEAVTRDGRLVIHHRTGIWFNETPGGSPGSHPLLATQGLILNKGERVKLVLADPNPFLFTYKVGDIVKTDTENYKAAVEFAKALGSLAETIGVKAAVESDASSEALSRFTLNMRSAVNKLRQDSRSARKAVQAPSPLPSALATAKAKLAAILKSIGIDGENAFLVKVSSAFVDLSSAGSMINDLIKKTSGTAKEVLDVRQTAADWHLTDLSHELTEAFKQIDAANGKLLANLSEVQAALPGSEFYVGATIIKAEQPKIESLMASLASFSDTLAKVDQEIDLKTIDFDPRSNSSITLQIDPVTDLSRAAADTKRLTGPVVFTFAPYSPVILGVGAAVVYSFVTTSHFTAKEQGTGLVIAETANSGELQGVNLAAMLTITPRGWADPTFGGRFEIGVSPKTNVGLFGGAGFTLYDLVTLGAGVAFQQVDRLTGGLIVGAPIHSADDIKTEKHFKVGGYIHMTLHADFTKK